MRINQPSLPGGNAEQLLGEIATLFNEVIEDVGDKRGWGQFLDAPRHHQRHLGLYGTSAGLVVLSMAGREISLDAKAALKFLEESWSNRQGDPAIRQRLTQNLRLALIHLALRVGPTGNPRHAQQVEEELLRRLLPGQGWGNYWVSPQEHDSVSRLLPTSICILAFALARNDNDPLPQSVMPAVDWIENQLEISTELPLRELAPAAAALLAAKGVNISEKSKRSIQALSLQSIPVGANEAYFYDYDFEINGDQLASSRDYFIVPISLFTAIAGYQEGASDRLRLEAERILRALSTNLKSFRGFKNSGSERLASVDQCWAAILLRASKAAPTPPRCWSRIVYDLLRVREDNWLTDPIIPAVSLAAATLLNAISKDLGTPTEAIAAVLTLIIGGIYGPNFLNKLLPYRNNNNANP